MLDCILFLIKTLELTTKNKKTYGAVLTVWYG
jgi:hypothetical protein